MTLSPQLAPAGVPPERAREVATRLEAELAERLRAGPLQLP